MDTARRLHKLSQEIEADLRLTGHYLASSGDHDLIGAAVEYLQQRYRDAEIRLIGNDGHCIVQCSMSLDGQGLSGNAGTPATCGGTHD